MRHAFFYLPFAILVGCSSAPPAAAPAAPPAAMKAPVMSPPPRAAVAAPAAVQPPAPDPGSREARMAEALKDYEGAKPAPVASSSEPVPATKKKTKARPKKTAPN